MMIINIVGLTGIALIIWWFGYTSLIRQLLKVTKYS